MLNRLLLIGRLAVAGLMAVLAAGPAGAALLGRAPATTGGSDWQAYYDDVLDITWLADANHARTSGYHATGWMTWDASVAFIDTLNTGGGLLGVTGWRLPYVFDVNADGCPGLSRLDVLGVDCGYYTNLNAHRAELSTLFYDTLGNEAFYKMDGSYPNPNQGMQHPGPFVNIDPGGLYWYGQENVANTSQAWYFGMPTGGQGPRPKIDTAPAWAVVDGDPFAVVPVPAAAPLFVSALGLVGLLRRRRTWGTAPLRHLS